MDLIEKYLGEITEGKTSKEEKDALRDMDNREFNKLRDSYYGVSDHIRNLVGSINSLNGNTGLFGKDLKFAKQALAAFDKIGLGAVL
jgi:hypothetical protein